MQPKTREPLIYSSFRRRPESMSLKSLDPGIRRDDGKVINQRFSSFLATVLLALAIPAMAPAAGQATPKDQSQAVQAEAPAAPPSDDKAESEQNRDMPRVVMARVGDEEITVAQFMELISKRPQLVRSATTSAGKARIVQTMIDSRLLKLAMQQEGLLPKRPGAADIQRAYLRLSKQYFPLPPTPGDKELYAYYQAHREEFGIPATVHVSQLQFRVPEGADEPQHQAARARAEQALQRLEKGESFAELARELTENSHAKVSGGDLGFLPRKASPWLDKALQGLKVGRHTGVVESPVGYEILLLMDVRETVITPFANVRDQVAQHLRLAAQAQARTEYIRKLAKEVGVEIVQKDLQGALP